VVRFDPRHSGADAGLRARARRQEPCSRNVAFQADPLDEGGTGRVDVA